MITAAIWLAWFGWLAEGLTSEIDRKFRHRLFWANFGLLSTLAAAILATIAVNR